MKAHTRQGAEFVSNKASRTDGDGSRQPSKIELDGARYQGKYVAQIATKLEG